MLDKCLINVTTSTKTMMHKIDKSVSSQSADAKKKRVFQREF